MNAPFPAADAPATEMPPLNLLIAAPRGFCAGVDRAIEIVEKALERYGAPVYVRHEIVHNKYVVEGLKARGVGTQVHYIPVHRQPYYRKLYGELELPGAEAWYARCLSLPLYPGMEDGDVATVVRTAPERER